MNDEVQQVYDLFVDCVAEVAVFTDLEGPDIHRAAAMFIERLEAMFTETEQAEIVNDEPNVLTT